MLIDQTSESFFYEAVVEALGRENVDASDHTEYYLVGLLDGYTKSGLPEEPLAFKYLKSSSPSTRVIELQEVGDTALYTTGIFPESLNRSLVGEDYYISIGSVAYGELSGRMQGALRSVFGELSDRFRRFVDVLMEVRETLSLHKVEEPTKVYS